jgi:hypothetical protein
MTTEVPQYPTATYPTAPPWAAAPPEPPAPVYGAVAPYGSPLPQHGQLLVPYPEEIDNAARLKPPAVWPVAPLTFLFLIPGIVSAARRGTRARRGRSSAAPYWITFAVSVVASWFLWSVIVAAAVPAFLAAYETAITDRVESSIVHDRQVAKAAGATIRTATCEPSGPRGVDGRRRYECLLTLDDTRTGTLNVVADRNGHWTAVTPAR